MMRSSLVKVLVDCPQLESIDLCNIGQAEAGHIPLLFSMFYVCTIDRTQQSFTLLSNRSYDQDSIVAEYDYMGASG